MFGLESFDGSLTTSVVKSMTQLLVGPAGARTTEPAHVNPYLACTGSMTAIVNDTPAHAVPARPVPDGLGLSTPGSKAPAGQSAPTAAAPQLGTSVTDSSVSLTPASGALLAFWIVIADGTVVPTTRLEGMSGGAETATPAQAGETPPSATAQIVSAPASATGMR